jgi:hypothetical protein
MVALLARMVRRHQVLAPVLDPLEEYRKGPSPAKKTIY